MKSNLGSEVLLRAKTLSEDNFATTDSLRASDHTWSTKRGWPRALRRIRTWGLQRIDRAITTCRLPLNRGIQGK